jgi:uncharacterized protein
MPSSTAQTPLHVIAKPFGAICNIACEYCFYLDKEKLYPHESRAGFRMADAVLERYIVQYIEAQPDGQEVNFSWQGGEPTLLGVDFFRRAVVLQKRHARSGQPVSNALQTNGMLLDDEWCAFLREEGFLVGISIDGPEHLHDRYRRDHQGRGTFARVMAGLEALQRNNVEWNALTVVQRENGEHGAEVYRFLKGIGARFLQFIPVVETLPGGGVSARSVESEQFGRFLNAVWDEWLAADIGEVFVQHFDMMLGLTLGYPASTCVHARTCGRAVALEHNGDVYSCDHFVNSAHNLGNIADSHLVRLLDGAQQSQFGQDKFDGLPAYCRECDFLRYCYGGCPAHRIALTPAGDPRLNHLCAGYKLFYAHTRPALQAMATALRRGGGARDYRQFLR